MKTLHRLINNLYIIFGELFLFFVLLGFSIGKNYAPLDCNHDLWEILASADIVIVSFVIASFSLISSRIGNEALTKHIQADAHKKLVAETIVILLVGVFLFVGDIVILIGRSCVCFQYGCLSGQIGLLLMPMISLAIRLNYNWLNRYEIEYSLPKYKGKYIASSSFVILYELLVKVIGDDIRNVEWVKYSQEYVRVKYDESAIGAHHALYDEFCAKIKTSVRMDGSDNSCLLNNIINERLSKSDIGTIDNEQSRKTFCEKIQKECNVISSNRGKSGRWFSITMLVVLSLLIRKAYCMGVVPKESMWWQSILIPMMGGFLMAIYLDYLHGVLYSRLKNIVVALVLLISLIVIIILAIHCFYMGFDESIWDSSIWAFAISLVTGFALNVGMDLIDCFDKITRRKKKENDKNESDENKESDQKNEKE